MIHFHLSITQPHRLRLPGRFARDVPYRSAPARSESVAKYHGRDRPLPEVPGDPRPRLVLVDKFGSNEDGPRGRELEETNRLTPMGKDDFVGSDGIARTGSLSRARRQRTSSYPLGARHHRGLPSRRRFYQLHLTQVISRPSRETPSAPAS